MTTVMKATMTATPLGADGKPSSSVHGHCFCAKFSDDTAMIAAGYADSTVLVFDGATGDQRYVLNGKSTLQGTMETLPTTCVRFRPQKAASKTRNVLVSAGANGAVQHWHITSQKCLHTIEEEDVEYSPGPLHRRLRAP
jgi:WD40 repeat protein